MATKRSKTKKHLLFNIVTLIIAIGHIEFLIISFIIRWIASILSIIFGTALAYTIFFIYITLPTPTVLSQYQHVPSYAIFDVRKTLIYKEWNTQRNLISELDVPYYRPFLPSKQIMAQYLSFQTNKLNSIKDRNSFQKKIVYLYSYNSIAATYMNAKIFQNGVVGIRDAADVYYQKDSRKLEKNLLTKLLSPSETVMKIHIYSRMPTEIAAIRAYLNKKMKNKKSGWVFVDTSLDIKIGIATAYQLLINPNTNTLVYEQGIIHAWTKKNDQLLAARAIIKTTEGGEHNE